MNTVARPRLFVSYSWSSPEHEAWVLDLATELNDSGVHVVLDKWDLREGHDTNAFMEQMVTDPTVSKVILVCDKVYASKADGRLGGVGTEAQIISAEVYAKKDQSKFVAVIAEKDDEGRPFLPAYYKSRMYVDLSDASRYSENFEKLLRWIFDKPLYVRPEIGEPPSYVVESTLPAMGTAVLAKRVIEGLRSDKGYALGALDEYLTTFASQIERFRISERGDEFDETIVKSIEAFIPARNEFIQVLSTFAQYSNPQKNVETIHRFFESLIPYFTAPAGVTSWREWDFDNFKFIVHELFLYAIAIFLRGEHFGAVTILLAQPYYVARNADYGRSATTNYCVFREFMKSLEHRNDRTKARRLSLRADMLEQRSKTSGVQFRHFMQADFVCYLRSYLIYTDYYQDRWWPETLVYALRQNGPFEVFARASSKRYLDRILPVLGVDEVEKIRQKLDELPQNQLVPRWDYQSINPAEMVGLKGLGSVA